MFFKLLFLLAGICGIVAVFYVSWFWRALIIPMVVVLLVDGFVSLWNKLKK